MVKFEIIKNTLETTPHKFKHYEEGCTTRQVTQMPETIASFDSLREARKALKNYVCTVRVVEGYSCKLIYVTEYYIEENTYTEYEDFDQGGELWDFAPLAYDETQNQEEE